MSRPALTYHGVTVDHPRGGDTTAALQLLTPSGSVRNVPVDRDELIALLADASKALAILTKVGAR